MPLQHVQEHIDLIAQHEQEFYKNRSRSERISDAVASFAGSMRFVVLHLLVFGLWIAFNLWPEMKSWRFDPYPFPLLDTIVALEAILLASFILMRQQRLGRRSDEREHLMLQVLLLTEKEATALLQLNRAMAAKLGLSNLSTDADIASLSEETPIDQVAENIKDSMPEPQTY